MSLRLHAKIPPSRNKREGHYFGFVGGKHVRVATGAKWSLKIMARRYDAFSGEEVILKGLLNA